jgi:hypothetical protein
MSTDVSEEHIASETSVYIRRTIRRYIPEDSTLHNHHCENLKTYKSTVAQPATPEKLKLYPGWIIQYCSDITEVELYDLIGIHKP